MYLPYSDHNGCKISYFAIAEKCAGKITLPLASCLIDVYECVKFKYEICIAYRELLLCIPKLLDQTDNTAESLHKR